MLDLFEARKAGLNLIDSPRSEDEAIRLVLKRMADHFWNVDTIPKTQFNSGLAELIIRPIFRGQAFFNAQTKRKERVRFVSQLPLSNDFGKYVLPSDCSLEQIEYFSDDITQLSIVRSSWESLDWLSKSVLVTHELLYMFHRREGLEKLRTDSLRNTSESSRKFVGRFFSIPALAPKFPGIPSGTKTITACGGVEDNESNLTYFYVLPNEHSGQLSLFFNVIFGASSFYQLKATFDDLSLTQLTDSSVKAFSVSTELVSEGSGERTGFFVSVSRRRSAPPVIELSYLSDNDSRSSKSQSNTRKIISVGTQTFDCDLRESTSH